MFNVKFFMFNLSINTVILIIIRILTKTIINNEYVRFLYFKAQNLI